MPPPTISESPRENALNHEISVRAAGLEFLERAADLAVGARAIRSCGPDVLARVDKEIVRVRRVHVSSVHLGIVGARKVGLVTVVLEASFRDRRRRDRLVVRQM